MNKTELQIYLNRCVETHGTGSFAEESAENRQKIFWRHIAFGHAKLLIAKRGFGATLQEHEAEAINREWESGALAGEIQAAMSEVLEQQFDVDSYLSGGVEAAIQFDREPTEADAAQASACRLLAEAAGHFRSAQGSGTDEARIDILIGQCVDATGVPAPQNHADPLQNAILAALAHLQKSREIVRRAPDGEDNDVAQNDGPVYPPSAWAHHLADRNAGNADNNTGALIEQLIAALQQLPDQIEDARRERRGNLHALFVNEGTTSEHAVSAGRGMPKAAPSPDSLFAFHSPELALVPPFSSFATVPAHPSQTFLAIGEILITKKSQDTSWDIKTARQARALYTLFSRVMAEEHGITTFALLRQPHLYAYDQFMRVLHTDYGRSPADNTRSIAQLREISRHKPPTQRGLAVPTRNRHLTQLNALLNEAASIGEHLDPGLSLTKLRGKKVGRARDQRPVPSENTVDAYFQSPVFMGCLSWKKLHIPGEQVFHRAAYFGPMLAYYQGMRREEFCGLSVDDVVSDNGLHPYLHIAPNDYRRLKNAQSQRNLALHPELIRLGLLDYVQAIKQAGHTRLFPDLYSPSSSSLLGDRLYRELAPMGRVLGISPHQFRHIFNDELKQKRVAQEFRADMLGHGGDSETTERYCKPASIAMQIEDLNKLPIRTAHIPRKPIQLLPWVLRGEAPPWSLSKRK